MSTECSPIIQKSTCQQGPVVRIFIEVPESEQQRQRLLAIVDKPKNVLLVDVESTRSQSDVGKRVDRSPFASLQFTNFDLTAESLRRFTEAKTTVARYGNPLLQCRVKVMVKMRKSIDETYFDKLGISN